MFKKLTTDEFIEKAKKIHGDKYNYSEVVYTYSKENVKIYCEKCEKYFYQIPNIHLSGHGCSTCTNCKKLTTEEFIEKAKNIHGDKYIYDKVEYINSKEKVKIYCEKCEKYFYQTPNSHLKNSGCPICANCKKLTTEDFIERSKKIHGDKYVYDDVEYINNHTKVKIYCTICEEFFYQVPNSHLNINGCPNCANNIKYTTEDFIEKAIKIHGDKYAYNDVEYIDAKTKVKIYCNKCGEYFYQKAGSHFMYGCNNCAIRERRLKIIKRIEDDKLNGNQLVPNYNKNACKLFDEIMLKENIFIQHAMNGGEFHIKELGYWVDGYDKENNTVYEYDEKRHHFDKNGNLKEKDLKRQKEIENFLGCTFIRIKEEL